MRLRRRELGIPVASLCKIRWTPEMIGRLGKNTDKALGHEWGIASITVYFKRRGLGIPAFGRRSLPRATRD